MLSRLSNGLRRGLLGFLALLLLGGLLATTAQASNYKKLETPTAPQAVVAPAAIPKSVSGSGYAPSSVNLGAIVAMPSLWWWQKLRHHRHSDMSYMYVNDVKYCGGGFRIDRGVQETRRLIKAIRVPKNTRLWKFGLRNWGPVTVKKPYTWCFKASGSYLAGDWVIKGGDKWGIG